MYIHVYAHTHTPYAQQGGFPRDSHGPIPGAAGGQGRCYYPDANQLTAPPALRLPQP